MHLLTKCEAGLIHGRSTEDQLLRLSQHISDGCQQSSIQRYVAALIDYLRSYDKVWRDVSLMKMSYEGIRSHMVWWIQAWLSDRLTWVIFDGVRSLNATLNKGVPHGSVLSLLLFLFCIDDLVSEVGARQVSLFADMLQCRRRTRTLRERHPDYRRK